MLTGFAGATEPQISRLREQSRADLPIKTSWSERLSRLESSLASERCRAEYNARENEILWKLYVENKMRADRLERQ